jgi:hypothetical protein
MFFYQYFLPEQTEKVSKPWVSNTVITPAMEYQSTNGDEAAGPKAFVTIGAITNGRYGPIQN